MSKWYAVMYEPGENWIANKSIHGQPLGPHVKYLADLHEKNIVKMGGPFADGRGGLVIVMAAGLEEVNEIVANDPAVVSGVLVAQAREWSRVV